jgi:hypothetical protein
METAFYNRVGFTSGWGYAEYNFYPDKTRYPWLRRVSRHRARPLLESVVPARF